MLAQDESFFGEGVFGVVTLMMMVLFHHHGKRKDGRARLYRRMKNARNNRKRRECHTHAGEGQRRRFALLGLTRSSNSGLLYRACKMSEGPIVSPPTCVRRSNTVGHTESARTFPPLFVLARPPSVDDALVLALPAVSTLVPSLCKTDSSNFSLAQNGRKNRAGSFFR